MTKILPESEQRNVPEIVTRSYLFSFKLSSDLIEQFELKTLSRMKEIMNSFESIDINNIIKVMNEDRKLFDERYYLKYGEFFHKVEYEIGTYGYVFDPFFVMYRSKS